MRIRISLLAIFFFNPLGRYSSIGRTTVCGTDNPCSSQGTFHMQQIIPHFKYRFPVSLFFIFVRGSRGRSPLKKNKPATGSRVS